MAQEDPPNPPRIENESEFKSKSGLQRILKATGYSLAGLSAAWKHEQAFRQELLLCLALLPIAIFAPISGYERLALIACLFLLLIVEILNSAIEAAVDRVSLDRHPFSKRAKDLGSAAVMLTLLLGLIVWLTVLVPIIFGSGV
jgi:diacylglycerol kinase (ATP)